MPIRGAQSLTFKASGLSDTPDATNTFPGAMSSLKDLIPNPRVRNQFIPRPASTQITNFAGFTTPGQGEGEIVIGNRVYGMIATGRFAGHSEPFCYDLAAGAFVTIAGPTAANTPTSQPTSGDWTPVTMAMVGNRIMITHPGYNGVTTFVGWIDIRGFTSAGKTGDTHTSTLVDALSANPITTGWQVGDRITGAGIPANTFIVSLTATSVTLSQAATATAAGVALTVTSGTRAAPVYGAGQTNTNALAAIPTAVAQFNGRAYYAVNNTLQYSDALLPLTITNATQALTLGDDVAINAIIGLPLGNQVIGGVLQSLIAFKGAGSYYQVTGDQATSDLKVDVVNGSVGTLSPLSLAPTPKGVAYVAPDGLRFINLDATSSDPIGNNGGGINVPFTYAVSPTRTAAAFNENLLRISVQNGFAEGQPFEEYWFDMNLGIFTGPHSFPAGLIASYRGAGSYFVMFAHGIDGKMWASRTKVDASSTYTENAVAMSWIWQTSLMPDNDAMAANQIIQSNLGMTLPASQSITILPLDEGGVTLDTISVAGSGMSGAIWNSFLWGTGIWGGTVTPYREYLLPWHVPLVFKQMMVRIVGQSQSGFSIGNFYTDYQITGYSGGHRP